MANGQEPVFVNLHHSMVQVFDENRRPLRVAPWENRHRGQDAVFEVKGDHYRQFVSSKGPLFPRPADAKPAEKASAPPPPPPPPPTLAEKVVEAKVPDAVKLIRESDDTEELNAVAAADERKGVLDAVEARIDELEE